MPVQNCLRSSSTPARHRRCILPPHATSVTSSVPSELRARGGHRCKLVGESAPSRERLRFLCSTLDFGRSPLQQDTSFHEFIHTHNAQTCSSVCVCVCVCVCAYTSTWEWQTLTSLFLYDTAYVEHQRIPCRAGSNSLIAMWRKFDWVDIVPKNEIRAGRRAQRLLLRPSAKRYVMVDTQKEKDGACTVRLCWCQRKGSGVFVPQNARGG